MLDRHKLLPLILVLAVVFVAGCTSSTEPQKIGEVNTATPTPQQSTPSPQPMTFKIGDIVSNNVIALTVNSIRFQDEIISTGQFGDTEWLPDEGKRFLIVDVTMQNVGKDSKYFAAGSLTVSDTNDFSYNIDSNYMLLDNKLDVASNIQPGKKTRGEVAFQIPIDAVPKELVYDDMFNKPISVQLKE